MRKGEALNPRKPDAVGHNLRITSGRYLMSRSDCASGVPANARVTITAAAPSSPGAMRPMVSRPMSSCRCGGAAARAQSKPPRVLASRGIRSTCRI